MKKILIVEDDQKIREIYAKFLISEEYSVIEASNAVDAYEILKKENIDLVLLDIKMPEINGSIMYEVLRLFHRDIKVIVSSVYPLYEQKEIISGAFDYHDKSQGIDVLLGKINNALGDG